MQFFSLDKTCNLSIFLEKEYGRDHEVYDCAPDEWAFNNGATHTLYIGKKKDIGGCGTRPAKLLKTVLYVGVDENETGGIKWEKWHGRITMEWNNVKPQDY
jgi:hypothetical protein